MPSTFRSRVLVLVAVVTVGLWGAGCGTSSSSILPDPTGDESIGVRDLAPVPGGFALRAWYPAEAGSGTPGAPWMTAAEWEKFASRFTNRSTKALARLQTTAAEDATPGRTDGSRSVVLLMPGWGAPAASTTILAEELASHGHVVVTIGPPLGSEPLDAGDDATFAAGARARLAAVSATLDRLADPRLAELVGPIDTDRVAAGGMSFGGPVGFAASLDERSIVAVFDLDGSLDAIPTMKPVVVPGLMIVTPTEGTFDAGNTTTQLLADSKEVVTVGIRRAAHCDLNDLEFILLATETNPLTSQPEPSASAKSAPPVRPRPP